MQAPGKQKKGKKGLSSKKSSGAKPGPEMILDKVDPKRAEKSMPSLQDRSRSARGGKELKPSLQTRPIKHQDIPQPTVSAEKPQSTTLANAAKPVAALRNLPTYVTQQVSRGVVRAINQGESTLKIQLKPPELGRLVMTIDNNGNSMKVSIMTENHAAKDILISHMGELKTTLANAGISLDQFDVDMNSNFKQSMADAGNQSGRFNHKGRNRGKKLIDPIQADSTLSVPVTMDIQDGSYHFVA
jgi:flagellar hook-length control protein FliK